MPPTQTKKAKDIALKQLPRTRPNWQSPIGFASPHVTSLRNASQKIPIGVGISLLEGDAENEHPRDRGEFILQKNDWKITPAATASPPLRELL
jgi:hypothetical protein